MVNEDIELAKEIINLRHISNRYEENFNCIYPFTNEKIKIYFDQFDFKGKDVLSVLASSDQVFDMFLRGAKSIDTFDPLTKYYFNLKKAAILALDYNSFIQFFDNYYIERIIMDEKAYSKSTFIEISKYLKGDCYIFWNTLFDNYSPCKLHKLFYKCHTDFQREHELIKSEYILYFDKKYYTKLQNNISTFDINFINYDLRDISDILNKKYDIMYLSNILDRLNTFLPSNEYKNEKRTQYFICFLKKLGQYLKKDGTILVNYFYDNYSGKTCMKNIENSKEFEKFTNIILNDNSSMLVYKK